MATGENAIPVRMANGTMVFIPQNGANIIQAGQGIPATVFQQPGMVHAAQQFGSFSNPPQQNQQVGALEKIRKETKILGAIQIMIGLIHIGFGAISFLLCVLSTHYIPVASTGAYPFWGAIFFIVSGSLAVSTEKNLSTSLIKCSVWMNVISAVVALIGILLYIAEVAINHHIDGDDVTKSVGTGLCVLLLLFSLLEFCISVSAAHFGCKATYHEEPATVYVPYSVSGDAVFPPEGNPPPPPYNQVPFLPK